MTSERLRQLLDRFDQVSVAVLGDFFVDQYLMIDPALAETSLETGLEAHQIVAARCQPGAAGTVTNNLSALGVGHITALGYTGADGLGFELRRGLQATRVDTSHLVEAPDRFTPTYTKPLVCAGDQPPRELNRLDLKNRAATPAELTAQVLAALHAVAGDVDALLVLDQVDEPDCGVVTAAVRQALTELAAARPALPIIADSRRHIAEFRGVMIKPNLLEASHALRADGLDPAALARDEVACRFAARAGRPCFITLGGEGVLVAEATAATHVAGIPVSGPVDIVGAGDSFSAASAATLAAGGTLLEAAQVGCLVASITVQQIGTTGTASPAGVRQRLAQAPWAG